LYSYEHNTNTKLTGPVLVRTGHLKPLGKPAQNSRKWFARVKIERLGSDLAWLDKAVRLAEKHVRDLNLKQRSGGKVSSEVPGGAVSDDSRE
jgi:hypothetical protein